MDGKKLRVLVTGGAGFIGSHLVALLLAQSCDVMSYDCLLPQVHPASPNWPEYQLPQEGLAIHFGDVRDPRAFAYALEHFQPDIIVHLAAKVGVGQSQHDIAQYVSTNITGTANVLDRVLAYNVAVKERAIEMEELLNASVKPEDGQTQIEAQAQYDERIAPMLEDLRKKPQKRIQQVLVAGSMSSYGEGAYAPPTDDPAVPFLELTQRLPKGWEPQPGGAWDPPGLLPVPITEDFALEPASVYAWTKAQQEELALLVWRTRGKAEGLDIKICRFFNTYGPNQSLVNPYTGACAIFAARAIAKLQLVLFEDGGQLRDFVYVTDVASAIWCVAKKGQAGEVYNVATGVDTPICRVAAAIWLAVNGEFFQPEMGLTEEEVWVTQAHRVGDIRHCFGDATKLKALGWFPQVALHDGLYHFVQWVKKQPLLATEAVLQRANEELAKYGLIHAR